MNPAYGRPLIRKVVSVLSICNALIGAGSSRYIKFEVKKYVNCSTAIFVKKGNQGASLLGSCAYKWVYSNDRLKFWVKLHLDAVSVMCSVHQLALETCDKYFSSLIKKSVQDSNNTTVLAMLVNCMVYVEDFIMTVSTMRSCITYVTKKNSYSCMY